MENFLSKVVKLEDEQVKLAIKSLAVDYGIRDPIDLKHLAERDITRIIKSYGLKKVGFGGCL